MSGNAKHWIKKMGCDAITGLVSGGVTYIAVLLVTGGDIVVASASGISVSVIVYHTRAVQ